MGIFGIYGVGCAVVFVIILMYIFNEVLHGKDITAKCITSFIFLIAMSWSCAFVVMWVVAINVLEFFKWENVIVIKGKQKE
jgi:hypothetical protein